MSKVQNIDGDIVVSGSLVVKGGFQNSSYARTVTRLSGAENNITNTQVSITDLGEEVGVIQNGRALFHPLAPENVQAVANKDGIAISWVFNGSFLENIIKTFIVEISKNDGVSWIQKLTPNTSTTYLFDRAVDGYPEKADLALWKVRISTENIYNQPSLTYGPSATGVTPDLTSYLTWIPPVPNLTVVAKETGLDCSWVIDQNSYYGTDKNFSLFLDNKSAAPTITYGLHEKSYLHPWDNTTLNYPEKNSNGGTLDNFRLKIKAASLENPTGTTSAEVAPNTTNYLTWIPPKPVVTAISKESTLDCSWTIDTSLYYGTGKTFEILLNGASRKTGIGMKEYKYYWNRDTDGYPEKNANGGTLDSMNVTVKATSTENTTGRTSDAAHPDTTWYLTWFPAKPVLQRGVSGRNVSLKITQGNAVYGTVGYEIQICRKGNGGTPADDAGFYATGDSSSAYTDESSYRTGAIGDFTQTPFGNFDQQLPLYLQSASLPRDTAYYYRVRVNVAVPTTASPTAKNVSVNSDGSFALARGTGVRDLVELSVGTAQIQQLAITNDKVAVGTLQAEKINVVARNKLNSLVNASEGTDGWNLDTGCSIVTVDGYRTLKALTSGGIGGGAQFITSEFEVLPDQLIELSFGLQCPNYSSGSGLYLGLTFGRAYTRYIFNFTTKKWDLSETNTNEYFINDFRSPDRKNFKTYILGSNIDINDVPAPKYSDQSYSIGCLKLAAGDTGTWLRTGFNATTAGTYWYLFLPQAYVVGSSRIVATQIIVKDLSAINASLGRITGDAGTERAYIIVMSDGYSDVIGNADYGKKGTLLLGALTDDSYFRRWYESSKWHIAMKMDSMTITSTSSDVTGNFSVSASGIIMPAFGVYPGSHVGVYGNPFLVYPGTAGNWNDGIRICNSANNYSMIVFGAEWNTGGWQAGQCDIRKLPSGNLEIHVPNAGNTAECTALIIEKGGNAYFNANINIAGGMNIGTSVTTGAIYPPSINFGSSFSTTNSRASCKIMLQNNGDGVNIYGFSVGAAGDLQYHSQYRHDFYINNQYNIGMTQGRIDVPALYSSGLNRSTHSSGFLVGSYVSVGPNDAKTNPIYTIGSACMPSDSSLGNMYGIGYSHSNLWGTAGIVARTGWGMYVCENGNLQAVICSGGIYTSGNLYVAGEGWFGGNVYGPTHPDTYRGALLATLDWVNRRHYIGTAVAIPQPDQNIRSFTAPGRGVAYITLCPFNTGSPAYVELNNVRIATAINPLNTSYESNTVTVIMNKNDQIVYYNGATYVADAQAYFAPHLYDQYN